MIGLTLSHYKLTRLLGTGGMGEVYAADDLALGRRVALKVLRKDLDASMRGRLVREARASARLQHPCIATFYESDEIGDTAFLAMQLVEGTTLRERLRQGPLEVDETITLMESLLAALGHAHAAGVLHRDIKPGNMMLPTDGGLRLLDFGIARVIQTEAQAAAATRTLTQITGAGQVAGTLGYMSPEQLRGESLDGRSDLFAVGAILYECLTGQPAFPGTTPAERIAAVFDGNVPSFDAGGISAALDPVVRRSLARDPEKRYPSPAEFLSDIRRVSEGKVVAELPDTLAIIDFENLSRQGEDDWIGSAMAESLGSDLARAEGLQVVAREKVLRARAQSTEDHSVMDATSAGRALGCRWILTGGYQKMGQALRITARVTETSTGQVVATHKLDGKVEDIFALQDQLAESAAESLAVNLSTVEEAPAASVQAYELYARGRRLFYQSGKESMRQAKELFEEALAVDPRYVPALTGLAGFNAMAWVHTTDPKMLVQAVELSRRALEEDPNSGDAHHWMGYALLRQGAPQEGYRHSCEANRLNPSDPWPLYMAGLSAWTLGNRRDALQHFQASLEAAPFPFSMLFLGWVHMELGHFIEAEWALRQLETLQGGSAIAPGSDSAFLAELLRRDGKLEEARGVALRGMARVEATDHMMRDVTRGFVLLSLGRVAIDQVDFEAAHAAFRQVEIQTQGRTAGAAMGHIRVQGLAGLAQAEGNSEIFEQAIDLFENREGYSFSFGPGVSDDFTLVRLASAAKSLGRDELAHELAQRALEAGSPEDLSGF